MNFKLVTWLVREKTGFAELEMILYGYFFCRRQILIRILEIIKYSPTTNRDIVGNWVKIENKKKLPNEIKESTENDG